MKMPNIGLLHTKLLKRFGLLYMFYIKTLDIINLRLFCHLFNEFLLWMLDLYPPHFIRLCLSILDTGNVVYLEYTKWVLV